MTDAAAAAVEAVLARAAPEPASLLPVLHAVQEALGHVPPEAAGAIGRHLGLSAAEVHGVVTFYHWFRTRPGGRHTVRLCRAEACQARGAEALQAHAERRLGCGLHGTGVGGVNLEPADCLGHCACGPSVLVDGQPHARVTPERLDAILAALGEKK